MIGDRIRRLRGTRTKTWLANQLGISHVAVCHWEAGANTPTPRNLIALCHVFGVSTDELLGVRPMRKRRAS